MLTLKTLPFKIQLSRFRLLKIVQQIKQYRGLPPQPVNLVPGSVTDKKRVKHENSCSRTKKQLHMKIEDF